jgi:hypothetical protein
LWSTPGKKSRLSGNLTAKTGVSQNFRFWETLKMQKAREGEEEIFSFARLCVSSWFIFRGFFVRLLKPGITGRLYRMILS